MKIENQVCKLGQAQKLVQLGLRLESIWYWHPVPTEIGERQTLWSLWSIREMCLITDICLPAYTVAELNYLKEQRAILIPENVRSDTEVKYNALAGWWSFAVGDVHRTEAASSAESLIFLIDKKYIKVEDLKL